MAGAYGVQAKFGVGDVAPATQALDIQSEGLKQVVEKVDLNGLKGSRSRDITRVREGRKRVGGPITLFPTPVELAYLLPKILGGTPVGQNYPLAETVPTFITQADRVMKVFTYNGLAVTRATFRGQSGGGLELTLDCIGQTETPGNAGTFPAIFIDTTTTPFMFHDLVLTLGGTPYQCNDLTLTIDNAIDAERFWNSQTLVTAQATDRNINISLTVPYGDASAFYTPATASAAVVATFTNGTVSVAFSLAAVAVAWESPVINGRGELVLPVNGQAYKTGATLELVTTLDSTP
jgi:hypothetical protein